MAARPDFGTKLECSSCGERFFDLNRTPITCPKCAYVYPTDDGKIAPVVEEKPAAKATEEASSDDEAEFVSLEEADAATISELTGDDDDDSNTPDEDSFLEEEGTSTSVEDIVVPTSNVDENDS